MVLIYIKLGTADQYDDEQLNFHLLEGVKEAQILDYTNINANIINGLIAGEIVQISAAEYYALTPLPTDPPITVIPTELINITDFLDPCPVDATLFFAYYAGKWYKVLWSTIRECAGGSGGIGDRLAFRVGDSGNNLSILPDVGDDRFINPALVDKDPDDLLVTINGVEVYHRSFYEDRGDEDDNDWWVLHEDAGPDDSPGMFKRSGDFSDKEIVVIRGL